MKTLKTKKYSILSNVKFDETHIANVTYNESLIAREFKDIGDDSEDPIVKVTDEIYHYVFFFNADLKKSLVNSLTNVRVSVRTKINKRKFDLFSDIRSNTPKEVIATVYGKETDNITRMIVGDLDGLIHRSNINLLEFFDFSKISRADRLTDVELFGTTKIIDTVSVDETQKLGKNYQLSQKNLSTIDQKYVNKLSVSENYEKSIVDNIDPPSLLFPTPSVTPANPSLRGTFSRQNIKSGNIVNDKLMFSLRKYVSGDDETHVNSTSLLDMPSGEFVGVEKIVPNIIRKISVKVKINKKDLSNSNTFFVDFEIIDKFGKVEQLITTEINHKINIENFYAPSGIISSNMSFSFASNRKSPKISLNNVDPNVDSYDIYMREISETQELIQSRFKKITSIRTNLLKNQNKVSVEKKLNMTLPIARQRIFIMRAIPVTMNKRIFNNFSSSVMGSKQFLLRRSSIYTAPTRTGIVVQIKNLSKNVLGVFFERRDVTIRQRDFTRVITSKNDGRFFPLSKPGLSKSSLSYHILDENVLPDHQYEYRARLFLKEGILTLSRVSRFQTFSQPMNFISVRPKNISSKVNSVKFDIGWHIKEKQADKLKASLASSGFTDLWEDDQKAAREDLMNILFFEVNRFNITSGESSYVGIYSQDETVHDDGRASSSIPPSAGMSYIYRITPTIVAPSLAFSALGSEKVQKLIAETKNLKDPSTYAKLRKMALNKAESNTTLASMIEDFDNSKVDKYFSKPGLEKGMIPRSSPNMLKEFSTGDWFDFDVNLSDLSVTLRLLSLTYAHGKGPILRLSASSQVKSHIKLIDSFVILCKKQGVKSVCGTCHKTTDSNLIFVDYSNKDYVGNISYHAIPVYLSGEFGSEQDLISTEMKERATIKARDN